MNDNIRPVFNHLLENFIKSFLIGHLNISPLLLKDVTLCDIVPPSYFSEEMSSQKISTKGEGEILYETGTEVENTRWIQ